MIPIRLAPGKAKKDSKFPFVRVTFGEYTRPNTGIFVGVDPGANFGLAIITAQQVIIANGHLPKSKSKPTGWEYGVEAYDFIRKYVMPLNAGTGIAVVEGASYGKKYGQVPLESERFAFYLGLLHNGYQVHVVPPATIRKEVFHNGKMQAMDYWPTINHNAADALSMSLYAKLIADGKY